MVDRYDGLLESNTRVVESTKELVKSSEQLVKSNQELKGRVQKLEPPKAACLVNNLAAGVQQYSPQAHPALG